MIAVYVTGLLLIAVVALAVADPFFHEHGDVDGTREGSVPGEENWRRQKNEAIAGIREAEFDFHLGKLSESDYRDLRRRLEAEALEAIHALEGDVGRDHDR